MIGLRCEPDIDRFMVMSRKCCKKRAISQAVPDGTGRRIAEPKIMANRLLSLFFQQLCPHRFSWPHSVHGRDYQVCVICGTAYEYDWTSMRRVRRLEQAEYESHAG